MSRVLSRWRDRRDERQGRGPADDGEDTEDRTDRRRGDRASRNGSASGRWASDLFEDETRAAIVEVARSRPGVNKSQIARAVGGTYETVSYHIGRLEKEGFLVTRRREGGIQVHCFVPGDQRLWEDERTRILFGTSAARPVVAYLVEHPSANTAEIAQALGQSPGNIRKHLRTLRDNDLVTSCQIDRKVRHRPLPVLRAWMDEVGQRLGASWEEAGRDGSAE